jgi:hypothetical protein
MSPAGLDAPIYLESATDALGFQQTRLRIDPFLQTV